MNFCIGGQQVRIGFFCRFMEGKIHPLAPSYYRFLHRHTVIIGVGLLKLVEGDRIPAIIEFAPLHINAVDPDIQFDGYYEYQEETLKRLFYAGHPCAIRTVIKEGEQDRWLPVMYLDDDGGVIWNPYSGESFLAELYKIEEICCFTIN